MGYLQGINQYHNTQLKISRPLTVVKLTTEILITQKQRLVGILQAMTENWTYAFCHIWEDVSDSHLGHIIWTQKNSAQNPFCEPY